MKKIFIVLLLSIVVLGWSGIGSADSRNIQTLGQEAFDIALKRLSPNENDDCACLTNAGYTTFKGQSTQGLYDIILGNIKFGFAKGNILAVHDRNGAPLWLAMVSKPSADKLMMVHVSITDAGITCSEPINVYISNGTSFKPFKDVLGKKAFSIVTLANGWADNIPEELLKGALFHDHLCCGVFSGYFTVKFIQEKISLGQDEQYIYIGAPAWCQDDYIIRALNLTPGKHGYYTMAYPWSRPWKTAQKSYDQLGGIIIQYNNKADSGQASLMRFDWQESEFKKFAHLPDGELDWKNQPWLHTIYNRFLMANLANPGKFVSVVKTRKLNNREDLDRLINMGSNPLEEMLGPDPEWKKSSAPKEKG